MKYNLPWSGTGNSGIIVVLIVQSASNNVVSKKTIFPI